VRTEDIVGISFFAILFPAIVMTISASRKSLTPQQQHRWRGIGLGMVSLALVVFGLANILLIHNSARPVVAGNLFDIRTSFGKQEHGTRFRIADATGHAVQIRCRYTGPGLVEGEEARIRYVAYDGKLLEMDLLSGPYQLWHLRESSGEQQCWGWVALGLVCGFFAYRQLRKERLRSMP